MAMDINQKQRAVIEFLLFEGYEDDDIVLCLQNAHGRDAHCPASVFRWMNEIRRGNEELRNERRPGKPYRYKTDAALRSILRDDPNASLRIIADRLSISLEMVRTHMSRIGYTPESVRWISRARTSELK
jgi:transposase